MVSRTERSAAVDLILKFYRYQIAASDMESEWPADRNDKAVRAIGRVVSNMFVSEGLVGGRDYADPELYRNFKIARFLHRCLVFLRSDCEYEWRELGMPPGGLNLDVWLARIMGRDSSEPAWTGDESMWPFFRREDYKRAWHEQHAS